jgi:prepilin-type N-terminal cleavage/methylation domain-containing protein
MSNTLHRRERGFTLVELSIVLVIIGLLIGAVLKGQELIDSARMKSQMTQLQSYKTAASIFRDRYNGIPGDYNGAEERFGATTDGGFGIADGDADGLIEANAGGTAEDEQFWAHLVATEMLTGIGGDEFILGEMLPSGKVGGGVNAISVAANGNTRNWLRLGTPNTAGDTTGALMIPADAAELDTQFDDGLADSGDIQATGNNCQSGGAYTFSNDTRQCVFFYDTSL